VASRDGFPAPPFHEPQLTSALASCGVSRRRPMPVRAGRRERARTEPASWLSPQKTEISQLCLIWRTVITALVPRRVPR